MARATTSTIAKMIHPQGVESSLDATIRAVVVGTGVGTGAVVVTTTCVVTGAVGVAGCRVGSADGDTAATGGTGAGVCFGGFGCGFGDCVGRAAGVRVGRAAGVRVGREGRLLGVRVAVGTRGGRVEVSVGAALGLAPDGRVGSDVLSGRGAELLPPHATASVAVASSTANHPHRGFRLALDASPHFTR
jgi:hypothetical protein